MERSTVLFCCIAIREYSGGKPVLVFVSSRRQTRLTGFALLSFASLEMDRRGDWMNMSQEELAQVLLSVRDPELKQLLNYGIGIHHAGLHDRDRVTVEHLFLNGKILVSKYTAVVYGFIVAKWFGMCLFLFVSSLAYPGKS